MGIVIPGFSVRMKELRKEYGLKQTEAAKLLQCTLRHYQKIEYGQVNLPTLDLILLADYFHVTTDYLLGRSDERGQGASRCGGNPPGGWTAKERASMKLTYPACFYPDEERKGAYAVVVPDLPGCASGGDTLADAILMATDAACGWVLDELEEGRAAPEASPLESVTPEPGGFVSLLALDMDAYAEKYGEKAVKKNLTIPAWLNTFAENNRINVSQVLQNSLTALYQQKQQV